MTEHLRLEVGPEADPTDLDADALEITLRRGLKPNGVTDDLEPAAFTAVVKGSTDNNPLLNTRTRSGQPVRFSASADGLLWSRLFTGTLDRALLEYDPSRKDDATRFRLTLTGTDLVAHLATLPSPTAVAGTLTQRVTAVLTGFGLGSIPFNVTDLETPGPTPALPTEGKTVLDQLRLVRDTLHAFMFVDKDGTFQAVADGARPRTHETPALVFTDDAATPGVYYHDITPVLDTDDVVNQLTVITLVTGGDPAEVTYTNTDSATAWGTKPQTITVNDGLPETHADLYLATRTDPTLIPRTVGFAVDLRSIDYDAHLAAACAVEIGDTVLAHRDGLPDTTLLVRDITHTISLATTPVPRLRWTVTLGLRVPEVLPTRWADVPADLTWADVPADLTWADAVHWHPYS